MSHGLSLQTGVGTAPPPNTSASVRLRRSYNARQRSSVEEHTVVPSEIGSVNETGQRTVSGALAGLQAIDESNNGDCRAGQWFPFELLELHLGQRGVLVRRPLFALGSVQYFLVGVPALTFRIEQFFLDLFRSFLALGCIPAK